MFQFLYLLHRNVQWMLIVQVNWHALVVVAEILASKPNRAQAMQHVW